MNKQDKFKNSFIYQRSVDSQEEWPYPVAVIAQVNEFIPQLCKLPYDYLFRGDAAAMAECVLLVWEYVGVDTMVNYFDVYNFEAESIGAKIKFEKDHLPSIDKSDLVIKDEKDFDKIRWNGAGSGRFPYIIDIYKAIAEFTGFEAYPPFCAPWSLACNIYGLENLIVSAMIDAGFVHEMMRRIIDDLQAPMYRELNGIMPGLREAELVDAWCSPPMVTNELVAEFSIPYIERLAEKIGIDGVQVNVGGLWGASYYTGERREAYMGLSVKAANNASVAHYDPDVRHPISFYAPQAAEPTVNLFVIRA